jgi:hypothetical protein
MNRSDARGRKTFEGWIGEFRPVWKSEYEEVQEIGTNGKFAGPKLFKTEAEAEAAAWRLLRDIEEPVMVRSGTIVSKARSAADALFKREASA